MKKVSVLLLTSLLVTSCVVSSITPIVKLSLSSVNGMDIDGMKYIDDIIAIEWSYINKSRLNFRIQNKSNSNIKIIWDNAAYVNVGGSTSRVMHLGVKYVDRNEAQSPSIIPTESFLDDAIIPTSVVAISSYGWTEGTLFSVSDNKPEANKQLMNTYGKNIKILLPIEINGVVTDYMFSFVVHPLS